MRTTSNVLAHRLDEADMSAHSALRSAAESTADQLAANDRVRRVAGVKPTRRDFGPLLAGLGAAMVARYANTLSDQ